MDRTQFSASSQLTETTWFLSPDGLWSAPWRETCDPSLLLALPCRLEEFFWITLIASYLISGYKYLKLRDGPNSFQATVAKCVLPKGSLFLIWSRDYMHTQRDLHILIYVSVSLGRQMRSFCIWNIYHHNSLWYNYYSELVHYISLQDSYFHHCTFSFFKERKHLLKHTLEPLAMALKELSI